MKNSKNERSLVPLLIISGLVAAPLVFIAGMIFGSQIQLSNILTADSLSSWVTALATVSIAVLTFILAKETWYLRASQIEQVNELKRENIRPNVSLVMKSSPVSINFKMVEVQNLGKGIARNVEFFFLNTNGQKIDSDPVVDSFLQIHIFSNGIASLGIGQKIESFLLSTIEIKSKLPEHNIFSPEFKIKITYEDVKGNKYENEIIISFKEFKGISTIGDTAPLHTMSQDLKKLRQQIEQMTSSSYKRLSINTYTSKDRKLENAENKRIIEERRQQTKPQVKDC